ncbi:MAG: hypothetical protein EBR82_17175 [Caulobacteraceae bacterium]|nr:hypothetical protein [Caulobacteraceae bacterium]
MGTLQETLAVYGLQGTLWVVALWRVGARPAVAVLAANLALSWWIGELFAGNDRAVAMIVVDLLTIIGLRELPVGPQEKFVALIALSMILWRTASSVIVPYMGHYTYAVAINCAVIAQLLIAGGLIDEWARRADHWLDSLHPRLARAARNLAATP